MGWRSSPVPLEVELDLGALARTAADLGSATVTLHAADYRFAHSAPVIGDRLRVEARPPVVDEDPGGPVLDLRIEMDGSRVGGELGSVGERLARRRDESLRALVERRVADDDGIDRCAVSLLDVLGRGPERVGESLRRPRRLLSRQPGAELALLQAGQLRDFIRVPRALLHQGEGLKNRV